MFQVSKTVTELCRKLQSTTNLILHFFLFKGCHEEINFKEAR